MSQWKMAGVRVRLGAPMRCGDRPLGFVARCLRFVPGQVPLLAMVPAAIRQLGLPPDWKSHESIRIFLESQIRFSPFFLVDPRSETPLVPTDKGNVKQRIETRFLKSGYGVSMDYARRGAEEGRLFEVEAIRAADRSGNPTQLAGFAFFRPGESQEHNLALDDNGRLNGDTDLAMLIGNSQWGGERNKGYGTIQSVAIEEGKSFFGADVDLDRDAPVIQWPAGDPAPVFLEYEANIAKTVTGNLKPLIGRIHAKDRGSGLASSNCRIAWDIGWQTAKPLKIGLGIRVARWVGF